MKALLDVVSAYVVSWLYEGEWMEDTQRIDERFFVVAQCGDGGTYVHEVTFFNDPKGADRLAKRVEERGIVDMQHWGFHEYFSLTLEQRWEQESYHENLHRHGRGHESNGWFSAGHA